MNISVVVTAATGDQDKVQLARTKMLCENADFSVFLLTTLDGNILYLMLNTTIQKMESDLTKINTIATAQRIIIKAKNTHGKYPCKF